MGIKILTDSVADIPKEIAKTLDIEVIPLTVNFEEGSYLDGVEITGEEFYEKLAKAEKLPTTSQVPPGEFINAFQRLTENDGEVIAILISSKLSGTYSSAVTAKEYLKSERITVIDSKNVSFSEGLIVIEAARLVKNGSSKSEIIDRIGYMVENMECKYIIDDMEYLKKGGRLTPSQALIGKLLNIKPILTMEEGRLVFHNKVRGKKKAIKWVMNQLRENNYSLEEKTVGLFHSDCHDFLMDLHKELNNNFKVKEIIESNVGAVVGAHAGPGCIAITFVK